jgi:adenosylcobinamide kinase/adenosylcobinamide-phosphate guanylyltransferase
MKSRKIILVGGGCRSGKSAFALTLARSLGDCRLFLATAQAGDDEMAARIRLHRDSRGNDFETVEEPVAICDVLRNAQNHDVVVLDCLTLWITNLLLTGADAHDVEAKVSELKDVLERRAVSVVMVTSEVGLGLVPETPLGRIFRDVTGLAHQCLADLADEVYFGVLGVMLRLKPGPIIPMVGGMAT